MEYQWSSQDNSSIDSLPLIGRVTPFDSNLLMATGFAKWGLTGGTAAAMILAEACAGREHQWASLFDPRRLDLRAAAASAVKENGETGDRMVWDRLVNRGSRPIEDLTPGEGDIVEHDGDKVAGYREDDGRLIAVSTRCTHLGCQVNWNAAERSWDCPCHGSRFGPDGSVLHGPARPFREKAPELTMTQSNPSEEHVRPTGSTDAQVAASGTMTEALELLERRGATCTLSPLGRPHRPKARRSY